MKKAIRWIILFGVVALFVALIVVNANKPVDRSGNVWDEGTTLGNLEAKNYYIYYTDLACPYCDVYSRILLENEEEFKKDYIQEKDILYEMRVTDFLYEFGEHKPDMSRWSAEAIYCARNEGKFWDYYREAIKSLYDDYYSKGIGSSKGAPMIEGMTVDYWLDIGHRIGLSGQFDSCVTEHRMLDEVKNNTQKAAKYVQGGLPYFKFNKFTTGGFDPSWDWSYVKKLLDAGL